MINSKWDKILSKVDFDMQPIVSIKNGKTFGVEVYLREKSFCSIANFFDEAFYDGVLYKVDLYLRELALKKLRKIDSETMRLFYNLDYRILNMPDFTAGNTKEIFEGLEMDSGLIYFDISERSTLREPNALKSLANRYKKDGFNISIDNFATGISGLQLLYYPNCDFIKLDRTFLNDITKSTKKKLFLSSIINMAHIMNIKVIISQIETKEEYYICKDLGADFIQGFFIEKPLSDPKRIYSSYSKIKELYKNDKRESNRNEIEKERITRVDSLHIDSSLVNLFEYFKKNSEYHFAPIVDSFNSLVGVVYEKDIKSVSYSQYGMALAKNSLSELTINKFMKNVLSVEITWGVDKMLEIYNMNKIDQSGIFITKNNEYFGFIDLNNLLELSYSKNLQLARDQNPLTKLPGNTQIEKFMDKAITKENTFHIVYFDFNDFKPFNDVYGFRQGDRAILIFSDIIKKYLSKEKVFIAHIGGDDFFIGFEDYIYEDVFKFIYEVQQLFRDEVQSLYTPKDRKNGYIKTKDRFSKERRFSLLGVAAAVIEIGKDIEKKDFDEVLNGAKKASKTSFIPIGISIFKRGIN